jgi:hypothetical protein
MTDTTKRVVIKSSTDVPNDENNQADQQWDLSNLSGASAYRTRMGEPQGCSTLAYDLN